MDDAAIPHLNAMTHLHLLSISGTEISPAGLAEIRAALEKTTKVYYD
jgi:hypothetical protein